jgi:hypothetical protein
MSSLQSVSAVTGLASLRHRARAARVAAAILVLCGAAGQAAPEPSGSGTAPTARVRPEIYAPVTLQADVSSLSAREREMLGLFIDAAKVMDGLFWQQAYGDRDALFASLKDPATRQFAEFNYGPWDRLDEDRPFVAGVGPKPEGARFYPADMTKEEFEAAKLDGKDSLYTMLERDARGALKVVPYHERWSRELGQAADYVERASRLANDPGLKHYLELRAQALRTDEYQPSDSAWLDMKQNRLDFVIGPIETYEDKLYGYKAAYEAYVLIKDLEWSARLARYASLLPGLQKGLPVPDKYKAEMPGTDSDLNAYDAVYYAGHCNAGSKTIAINLPNDEEVQLRKGSRRLQLKNAVRAKFDKIMVPIADELIDAGQLRHVTFDAFFAFVMFHEIAHGLGIKNTVDGRGTVREALKELDGGLEEQKADVLGLYMLTKLNERGEVQGTLEDYYVTFLAGIIRSVRWGATEAHARANMVTFNYFAEAGAFSRDAATGRYKVDVPATRKAIDNLSTLILTLQGNGDYIGLKALSASKGVVAPQLQTDLDRLTARNIPVDIVFNQGTTVLGLH